MKSTIILITLFCCTLNINAEVKRVNVINIITGQKFSAIFGIEKSLPIEKMQHWIDKQILKTEDCNGWGCSARDVPKFSGQYNPDLVISEYVRDGETWVKLKADYEIKIIDLTQQHDQMQSTIAARKLEIEEIKQAISLIDTTDKPAWEKKLLKRLIKELRE